MRHARNAALAWRWAPQLARRTAVLRQRREASRRHSALSQGTGRPQSARHGARAQQVRVLRLLPRDSQRRHARAERDTRRWLGVGRHSWYVASRPSKERALSLAQHRCAGYEQTTTRAVRRAGAASSSATLIRKRPLGASPSTARAEIRHQFTLYLLGKIVIPRSGFHRSVGCFNAAAPSGHPQTRWSASVDM